MEFHSAQVTKGPPVSGANCSVKAGDRLVEVFQRTAEGGQPYLFVEDELGNPVGVLAAEDVLRRVTDPNPMAFTRWMDMPAELALDSRIEMPEDARPAEESESTTHTRVSKDGVLLGMITEDDVLISWRSVQKTLQDSQGDSVTNLPNRATLDQHLDAELNRGRRCHHSVGVILVDLDYFKQINDQFGHAAGDTALKTIAKTLRGSLRSYDMVARFGGDEFAVVCSGCRPGEIDIVIRRLRERILSLQENPTASRPLPTISVGAAVAHDLWAIQDEHQLVKAADEALYEAKRVGRNCAYKVELGADRSEEFVFVEDRYSHSSQPVADASAQRGP